MPSLHVGKAPSCQHCAAAPTASSSTSSTHKSSANADASRHEDSCAVANNSHSIRTMCRCASSAVTSSNINVMCRSASSVHEHEHYCRADEQPSGDSARRRTRLAARAGAQPTRHR